MSDPPVCHSCGAKLEDTVLDLGEQPLANAYLTREEVEAGAERRYPLHVYICRECLLVQVGQVVRPEEVFTDYAYFSSYSTSWVSHCAEYAQYVTERLALGPASQVVEIASNDGYLLKHFVHFGVPVLGVEPAGNVAAEAISAGIPTEIAFFGRKLAADLVTRGIAADLVVANNVLAHVPDLDDFVGGIVTVLKPAGVLTVEVPHLLRMIERTEFDTIYHEHLSYFSLLVACDVLARRGLHVFDVEELPTHGGSLRIWATTSEGTETWSTTPAVERVLVAEQAAGLGALDSYRSFAPAVRRLVDDLRRFLHEAGTRGERVAAYGAAAKASTLLNAAGVTASDIAYVADRNPHKQGKFLPGSHIPIVAPDYVRSDRPAYLLLLAWNLRDEVMGQMADVRDWGCRFVVPVPRLELVS